MTPKKGFQDIIKKFGEKIAGIGSRIKGFFTLNDAEKEAEAVSKKRLSSKPLPKSANKKADVYKRQIADLFHVSTDYLLGLETNMLIDADGLSDKEIGMLTELAEYFRSQK